MWPFRKRKTILAERAGGSMTLAEQYIDEFPHLTIDEILCVHALRMTEADRVRSQQGIATAPTSSDAPKRGGGDARQ